MNNVNTYVTRCLISILIGIFALIDITFAGEHEHPLTYLSNKKWELQEFFQQKPLCKTFVSDLMNNLKTIQVIPPVVETKDWNNPEMQKYLAGCDKESFIVSEEQGRVKVGNGKYAEVPSGKYWFSMERYALWKLDLNNKKNDAANLILYTGPMYGPSLERNIKNIDKEKLQKKYLDWGSFHEIKMPGCTEGRSHSAGNFVEQGRLPPPRESQLINYKGKKFLLILRQRMIKKEVKYSASLVGLDNKYICSVRELMD